MSMSQVVVKKLCQILVKSNLQLCQSIRKGGVDVQKLYKHFEKTDQKINEFSKIIENIETKNNETQDNVEEYDKLIDRIEKIKQDRQKDIENDKKWSEMDDENGELIERLNRLKPVEIVKEPESDIEEILKKEEEIERQKDEYFEERERQGPRSN